MEVFEQQNRCQSGGGGKFVAGMIVGIATALLVVCVGYVGYQIQQRVEGGGQGSQQVNAGGSGKDGKLSDAVADKIDTLEYMIEHYYYKDDISREDLENGIYQGLMDAVGAPYTIYFTASDFSTCM